MSDFCIEGCGSEIYEARIAELEGRLEFTPFLMAEKRQQTVSPAGTRPSPCRTSASPNWSGPCGSFRP